MDTQIKELKKNVSKQQQQGAAIKRSVTSEQAAVDALSMRRTDLISAAAMEQVRPASSLLSPATCIHLPLASAQ